MASDDLSERIALYAIDALPDDDRESIESLLAQSSDWAAELAEYQRVVAALPYSVPQVPMAIDLKDRLLQKIVQDDRQLADFLEDLQAKATQVQWEPFGSNPDAMIGTLSVDAEQRQVQFFVRAGGAVKFPAHRHAQAEEIVVLEGDLVIDGQRYAPGDRIVSVPGSAHQPLTETGCLLFTRTSIDDEMLPTE